MVNGHAWLRINYLDIKNWTQWHRPTSVSGFSEAWLAERVHRMDLAAETTEMLISFAIEFLPRDAAMLARSWES